MGSVTVNDLDTRIDTWRAALLRNRAVSAPDVDELESHLRDQIADLGQAGLNEEEAFLIAVKRLGEVDPLTSEYARVHAERLWKQLVLTDAGAPDSGRFGTMLIFAAIAVVLVQTARLLAGFPNSDQPWFLRNLGFLAAATLAAYFGVRRHIGARRWIVLAATVVVLAVVVNVMPHTTATDILVALHLPFLLWFAVGVAFVGDLRSSSARMDFVRFTGEWAIYYVLIALGGGVLMGLTFAILTPIAPDAINGVGEWVIPSGAAAAIIVAAWLVEAKKSVVENLAPVLTAIFTPLFAVMLVVSAVAYAAVGMGANFDRDLLTVFDVLLIVVVALVVYGISARAVEAPAGIMDVVRVIAIAAAILLDVIVLVAMFDRVGEFGFTANRVAALGLNLVLLANLIGTLWHSARLLAGRGRSAQVETWQTGYLPVFAGWLLVVVLVLPVVFG